MSLLEYVLLVTLIAMVGIGGLIYLGQSDSSAGHVANNVAVGVSGGAGTSPGPPSSTWCTSGNAGCTDTIDISGDQTVNFWASGGVPQYSANLTGAPGFIKLETFDPTSGKGTVTIEPTDCEEVGTYDVAIVVADSSTPQSTGRLEFSLTVAPSSTCSTATS